jgi:uroporphyrinogen decarboxylase
VLDQLAGMLGLPPMAAGPQEMTHRERLLATLEGDRPDRPPVCFWHHFEPAGSGVSLAKQSVKFFVDDYDLDIVKVMPDLPYPFPNNSIQSVNDWRLIEPIDPHRSPWVQQQAECVSSILSELITTTPIVVTMFGPLTEALHFAQSPEQFFEHLQQAPAVVHRALSVIAENERHAAEQVIRSGADGIFFALQGATTTVMPETMYREIGRPYDFAALRGAQSGWLNILHLHGEKDLMFDLALTYPVQVLNWSDRIAGPSLREARMKTSLSLMGGWNEQGAIVIGSGEDIEREALDAFEQTNGLRFILTPGCSIPDDIADEQLTAARMAADALFSDEYYSEETDEDA